MWFKNLVVYRVPARWDMSAETLAEQLQSQAFAPGSALEEITAGWAPPLPGEDDLVVPVQGQLLFTYRQEKKLLPAKVVTQFVKERAQRMEEEDGFKPGRKQMKELKEQIRDELLPRAFSLSSDTRVWIDPKNGWLAVDTGSATRAEEIFALLAKAVQHFPGKPLRLANPVGGAMTGWLATTEGPRGFTVDQDAELSAKQGKGSIRYANESLESAELAKHIEGGKQCTKLALTWSDKVSFVLTDKAEIKRIRALDLLKESMEGQEGSEPRERFQADMLLMTRELAQLLDDLVDGLGGEAIAKAA
ncbi:MAG: recombination-associated protein RdgC [Burkholderiaceae bacterium]